ncbi:MAG: glycosyltransferase [Desulfobacteraceae bacterium]|nr:glycosyltransferase [Desulfobacteraceae bacterium]
MIPVAYFIPDLNIGGAQRHLLQVFRHLDRNRFEPLLFCLGKSGGQDLHARIGELGVEIVDVGFQGTLRAANLQRLVRLSLHLRRKNVRVVHGYLLEGNFIGVVAGKLAGVPVLINSRRSSFDQYSRSQLAAVRLANRLSDQVTANSRAVSQFVRTSEECPPEKVVIIPNGVDSDFPVLSPGQCIELRRQWDIPDKSFVVGTVARFSWKKGYEYFLQMASGVLRLRKNIHFVAIGDGPLFGEMRGRAEELGIARSVTFAGAQPEAAASMQIFDVFVCTSLMEGMSNALLEAMARGIPVVATDVGGNPENVVHGLTGYLVPPKSVREMAEAVLSIHGNPELAGKMGRAAKARVATTYASETMVRRMEGLYTRLLREKGGDHNGK